MKNKIVILFISSLIMGACKKKDPQYNRYANYVDMLSATRNGKDWKLKIGGYYDTGGHFILDIVDLREDGSFWDQLEIFNLPKQQGQFVIADPSVWSKSTKDSIKRMPYIRYNGSFNEGPDVGGAYYISSISEPYIKLDYFNEKSNEVRGSFYCVIRRSKAPPPGGIDSVEYKNVTFAVKLWPNIYDFFGLTK